VRAGAMYDISYTKKRKIMKLAVIHVKPYTNG